MALPGSGPISLGNNTGDTTTISANRELTKASPYQQTISMNDSDLRTLAGVPSGTISFANLIGKAYTFFVSFAGGTNVDLRTTAIASGWDGVRPLVVTNTGNITSASTGSYALTISGSFPNGVSFINNGTIVGRGGAGANGASIDQTNSRGFWSGYPRYAAAGGAGGPALNAATAVTITNNGTIAGGGGGGGGGSGGAYQENTKSGFVYIALHGGGGGGGAGNGSAGSGIYWDHGTPVNPGDGGVGSVSAGGGGGGGQPYPNSGSYYRIYSGNGGSGGGYAASGASGTSWYSPNGYSIGVNPSGGSWVWGGAGVPASAGGAGGAAVNGNGNISWAATGTRYGSIT